MNSLYLTAVLVIPAEMALHTQLRRLFAVDWLVIFYTIISGLFISAFYKSIPSASIHLFLRVLILAVILCLPLFDKYYGNLLFQFLRNAYPLILLGFFYAETDALNNVFVKDLDYSFARLDSMIFGIQPSLEFFNQFPQKWFSELMNFFYFSYYFHIAAFTIIIFIKNKGIFVPCVFIITCSFLIYYTIFIFVPVGGPQYFFEPPHNSIPDSGLFRWLVKFVEQLGERPTAAFPSSHVGIILIVIILAIQNQKNTLWWLIPFFAGICFSTVYLKAHYAVDVLGGIVSAPIIYLFSLLIWKKLKPTITDSKSKLYA